MHAAENIVLLFAFIAVLVLLARKLGQPYPIVLVLAGLALSFVPHLPQVRLDPDVVFFFFLPALIYPTAVSTSWRDFRRNLRPIAQLSIALVLVTMIVVAVVAHQLVPSMPWAAAFALGAIVSPPDAIAATAVIRRLSLPHRIEVILEGESLVNDATALVALQFAVAALMTGSFSLGAAAGRFVLVALGGAAFGLLVGVVVKRLHERLDDPPVETTISLLTPFVAYLPAERMHVSGVLAVVTAGIYLGWHTPLIVSAQYRLRADAFWKMLTFLLNGFVFMVIGLQLPSIRHSLPGDSFARLALTGLLVSLSAILVRIIWVFTSAYLMRFFLPALRRQDPYPGWRNVLIVSWSGMRGVISLAAAFALPLTLTGDRAFVARDHILFLTFCVILVTLVFQGLTLPVLIRWLGIKPDTALEDEERDARYRANEAALKLIEQLQRDNAFSTGVITRLHDDYEERLEQLRLCGDTPAERRGEVATREFQQLQLRALQVERETIIQLRNQHVINDAALRRIQRDLDLAEAQIGD